MSIDLLEDPFCFDLGYRNVERRQDRVSLEVLGTTSVSIMNPVHSEPSPPARWMGKARCCTHDGTAVSDEESGRRRPFRLFCRIQSTVRARLVRDGTISICSASSLVFFVCKGTTVTIKPDRGKIHVEGGVFCHQSDGARLRLIGHTERRDAKRERSCGYPIFVPQIIQDHHIFVLASTHLPW